MCNVYYRLRLLQLYNKLQYVTIAKAKHCICRWEFIPTGIRAIPIPIQGDSDSHSQLCHQFPFPWDSHGIPKGDWGSHSHDHLALLLMVMCRHLFLLLSY